MVLDPDTYGRLKDFCSHVQPSNEFEHPDLSVPDDRQGSTPDGRYDIDEQRCSFCRIEESAGRACSIVNFICAEECPAGAAQCDAVPELLSWAAAHGAQCDRLQTDTTLAIRGLTATTDIPGGSVIVSLPRSLALSVSPSQSCPVPHLIPEDVWSSSIKYDPLVTMHLSRLG